MDAVLGAGLVNPVGAVTASVYIPGGTDAKLYVPSAPLWVERTACPLPLSVMPAFGTGAPMLSVTLPWMLPSLVPPVGVAHAVGVSARAAMMDSARVNALSVLISTLLNAPSASRFSLLASRFSLPPEQRAPAPKSHASPVCEVFALCC
jgi:hypothetical protein